MPLHPWMKLHFVTLLQKQFLPRCHTSLMQLTQFSLIVGKATGKNRVSYSISFSCKMRWFSQWRQILESLCLPSSKKRELQMPALSSSPLHFLTHWYTYSTFTKYFIMVENGSKMSHFSKSIFNCYFTLNENCSRRIKIKRPNY